MAVQYDLKEQERVYATFAKFYDAIYLWLFALSHRRIAAAASAGGPKILEIGAGTGLVLRYYSRDREVVAADLSVAMLRKAQEKVSRLGLSHVSGIVAMDACNLGFPDEAFDVVSIPFMITLVPDPEKALDEAFRVLKPGGTIVIISRFGAEDGLQAKIEEAIAPLMKRIGLSSSFKVSRVSNWAKARGDITMTSVDRGLYFKMLTLRKR